MKKYIVAVSGLTNEEEKRFIEFLESKGLGWWHWITNFWLIADGGDDTNAGEMRTLLMDFVESKRGIVIDIPTHNIWAGFSEKSKSEEMFDWLNRNWKK